MSLYAVKNDEGKWLWVDTFRYPHWPEDISNAQEYGEKADALGDAEDFGGHVVELVEKPEPVEVSEEDGARLEKIRKATCPWDTVSFYAGRNKEYANFLMRAYVNGWKVEKPKRFVLPMDGTEYHNGKMHGEAQYYAVKGTENWRPDAIALGTDDAVEHGYTVTQADIGAAPDWVKAIKPVEVTDDEQ